MYGRLSNNWRQKSITDTWSWKSLCSCIINNVIKLSSAEIYVPRIFLSTTYTLILNALEINAKSNSSSAFERGFLIAYILYIVPAFLKSLDLHCLIGLNLILDDHRALTNQTCDYLGLSLKNVWGYYIFLPNGLINWVRNLLKMHTMIFFGNITH